MRTSYTHANVLHRNSAKGWRWASDVFAVMLITINVTGLFILKGRYGITGRGKWLIGFGVLPPLIALIVYEII
ncbi:MAG TPA: PepSY-associated TM helix domain-containing protein [Thermodesulfobacteriota bacterium]|nr:PepSY-associated TM helix domain-containing protein [Thermodesulfobacteriota bacterium]